MKKAVIKCRRTSSISPVAVTDWFKHLPLVLVAELYSFFGLHEHLVTFARVSKLFESAARRPQSWSHSHHGVELLGSRVTDEAVSRLVHGWHFRAGAIELSETVVSDKGLLQLVQQQPRLTGLYITHKSLYLELGQSSSMLRSIRSLSFLTACSHQLRTLELWSLDLPASEFGVLQHLTALEDLMLGDLASITDAQIEFLDPLTQLRNLAIDGCRRVTAGAVIKQVLKCPQLQSLFLPDIRLVDLQTLEAAQRKLHTIYLPSYEVENSWVMLNAVKSWPLTTLHVEIISPQCLSSLVGYQTLKTLDICPTVPLNVTFWKLSAPPTTLAALESLDISGLPLCSTLQSLSLPKLRLLSLHECHISKKFLGKATVPKTVVQLVLSRCQFTKAGFNQLLSEIKLTLQRLVIEKPRRLTREVLLRQLTSLPSLSRLSLSGCGFHWSAEDRQKFNMDKKRPVDITYW